MAYDEALAARVREEIGPEFDVVEKGMFGGLAFLVGGHMALAVSGRGGMLVRVEPEDHDLFLAEPGASPFEMRGKPLRGWLWVESDDVATWVRRGVDHARSLPPK